MKILQSLSAIRLPAISANIDSYLEACFQRASDDSSDIRRLVCVSLGIILNSRADKLVPHMNNVVNFIAFCTEDQDNSVALEACEFWLTFAEDQALRDTLRQYLGRIAPLLLAGMNYSEDDLMYLENDEDDEAQPDKETDIKPRAYGGKAHGVETNDPAAAQVSGKSREAADEEDDDEEEYYDDDEDATTEWNIRKCSAAALDVMAVSFGTDLLEVLLPYLKERLFSQDWHERESGILALGAIAEGKWESLYPG
jgi:transportin-1